MTNRTLWWKNLKKNIVLACHALVTVMLPVGYLCGGNFTNEVSVGRDHVGTFSTLNVCLDVVNEFEIKREYHLV